MLTEADWKKGRMMRDQTAPQKIHKNTILNQPGRNVVTVTKKHESIVTDFDKEASRGVSSVILGVDTAQGVDQSTPPSLLRQALSALPYGVLLFDRDDLLVLYNDAAKRMLAFVGGYLTLGTPFTELAQASAAYHGTAVAGQDADLWLARRLMGHAVPEWSVDLQIGETEWRRVQDQALPGGGRLVSLMDISAKKRVDTTLVYRERRLKSILDTVLDAIIVIDPSGIIQTFNPAAERLFGYESADILGKPVSVLMPQSDARRHQEYVDSYIQTGRARVIGYGREVIGRRRDGSVVPLELSLSEVHEGEEHFFVGVARDVSTRKQAEQALRDSEQRLALAMEGTSEAIVDWDPLGDHLVCGERLRSVMGVSPTAVRTMEDWIVTIHPEDRPSYRIALQSALERAQLHFRHEARLAVQAADGGDWWIRHRAIAVRDPSGNTVRLVGSVEDVTQARRSAERLRAARNAADLANRAKSEFLANMSHELRTPLNAIIGFSELMADEPFGPLGAPQYGEYMQDIRKSGTRLLDIINDILDVSCLEAGQLSMDREPVRVQALIESAARLMTSRAEACGVSLRVERCDRIEQIVLTGDGRRLKQVLLNLLSNAVKFTPEHGQVTLSCHCLPERDVAKQDVAKQDVVKQGADVESVQLVVRDTGIGIEPDLIPHVLKPFYRLEGPLRRRYEGIGLGLPLTQAFVELHGGTLVIESTPGQGTCATVTLPVGAASPAGTTVL